MNNEDGFQLEKSRRWLLHSGIQNVKGQSHEVGGFNSWYDTLKKNYPYIYSEITGYGLTTLMYLNSLSPDELYLDRGELAASWLMEQATHESGGVRTRYFYQDPPEGYDWLQGYVYAFDTAMVLFGIMSLYEATKKDIYLKYGLRLGDFLLSLQQESGGFYAYLDPKTGDKIDKPDTWSTQSGAYHAKHALGLLKLHHFSGSDNYKKAAEKVCDFALTLQRPEGRFVNFSREGDTHLHPHSYACEGLFFAGNYLNREDYLEAARKGSLWALTGQLESGGIPSMYFENSQKFGAFERTDEMSQVLRMYLLTHKGQSENSVDKVRRLARRLSQLQNHSDDSAADGGFLYGFGEEATAVDRQKDRGDHVNSWCSMFAHQALDVFLNFKNNSKEALNYLI